MIAKPAPPGSGSGGSFKGITLNVPTTGTSSSTGDLYGLADWGQQNVNPGDLPILNALIGKGSKTTGDDIVKAFASADPTSLAEIQRALYLGGFYGQNSTYTPTYGVVSAQDVTAFGDAVKLAGQSGTSVSDLLLEHAKVGTAAGIAAAQQQFSARHTASLAPKISAVTVPATGTLEAEAMNAFEKVLGRRAKPKEAAAFAAMYQSMVAGVQRANIAAEQQAVQQASGSGLSTSEAVSFGQQLANIGTPGAAPTLEENPPPGVPRQAWDNPQERALAEQGVSSFGQQMGQLQTLGEAVTASAAAKTPVIGGRRTAVIQEQQPEDPGVAAENFARNTHPHAAARSDLGGAVDMFLQLLGSHGGA